MPDFYVLYCNIILCYSILYFYKWPFFIVYSPSFPFYTDSSKIILIYKNVFFQIFWCYFLNTIYLYYIIYIC